MNKIRISAILAMLCTTACAANVSVMATRKYVDNATNAVYTAAKGYVDTAVKDAGKVQSVNGKTGAVALAAADVGAVATNDFSAATNALAEAVASATPANYAAVSNAAMTALQPAATNGLVTASVTNGLASAAYVEEMTKNAVTNDVNGNVAISGELGVGCSVSLASSLNLYGEDGYITAKGITTENGFTVGDPDGEYITLDEYGISFDTDGTTTVERDAIASSSVTALALTVSRTNVTDHFWATNNPHGVTAAQIGALTAESDPAFDAWANGTSIAIGFESSADDCVAIGTSSKARDLSVAIGETAKATGNSSVVIGCFSEATNSSTIVIGNMAHAIGRGSIAIGHEVYVTNESCIAFGEFPSNVLFGATYGAYWELDASARSLQSYLDERVKTDELASVAKSGDYNDLTNKPAFVAASGEVVFSNNWKGVRFYGDVTHHGPATFNDTVTFNGTTAFAKGVKATSLGASGWYSNAEQSVELSAHTKSGGNDHNYIHIVSRGDEGTKVSNITPDNSDVLTWNMLNAAIPSILDALDSETATAADIVVALQSIYARFYTVKYVDNTGDGSVTKKVREGRFAKEPAKPTSSTSTFLGWYASGATNAFDFAGTPITNDVTLTAKWKAN